ncbi:sensor histidine kinase [Microbacterium indicum]|uniref:sensor histidine kinase n=1 Tax=Microbacterium indicum TaxID=358100 RepID=UPI0004009CF0|nr:histidine kinase [Microbacterium indicum]
MTTPLGARRLTRGIAVTWWYTLSGVLAMEAVAAFIWTVSPLGTRVPGERVLLVAVGSVAWFASTVPLLWAYRMRDEAEWSHGWRRAGIALAASLAFGLLAWWAVGSWILLAAPVAQTLVLLNWPQGTRLRVSIGATLLVAAAWAVDARVTFPADGGWAVANGGWTSGFISVVLPAASVLSLWWWDVVRTLDAARAADARLGATQERLRVANDVHDLQGHHLQVIALQLELAERLMPRDPGAALDQLRLARASVEEARQGTRDLAMRFRGVPVADEIANAVDLLRAAGTSAEAEVDPGASSAPSGVLGPVIRETTTNVLRHGGGRWARLSLARVPEGWRYEIANDAGAPGEGGGSGLAGIERRVAEAGGAAEIRRGARDFAVVAIVPEEVPA